MQRKPMIVLIAATTIVLSMTSASRADFLKWRYNWNPSTLKIISDSTPTRFVTLPGDPPPHDGGLFGLGILRRARGAQREPSNPPEQRPAEARPGERVRSLIPH